MNKKSHRKCAKLICVNKKKLSNKSNQSIIQSNYPIKSQICDGEKRECRAFLANSKPRVPPFREFSKLKFKQILNQTKNINKQIRNGIHQEISHQVSFSRKIKNPREVFCLEICCQEIYLQEPRRSTQTLCYPHQGKRWQDLRHQGRYSLVCIQDAH